MNMLTRKCSSDDAVVFMQKRGCTIVIPAGKKTVFHCNKDAYGQPIGIYDEESGILEYVPVSERERLIFLGKPGRLMDEDAFIDLSW